jgi:thymidylate synthase
MKVLQDANVHQIFPVALNYLRDHGIRRESRNGPVLVSPEPVTSVYTKPWQRVMFWPERDCNPALHLYESLWMLCGRNDVAALVRYAKQFNNYSDDGISLHGAYGYRWKHHFGRNQLAVIAERLKRDPDDRRNVLSMWDAHVDLDRPGKDIPCNLSVTFQRNHLGNLDMVVFNRSNDIVWGCYGANAVHFSFLLEYMANLIGCKIGTYTQISVNWHGYLSTIEPLASITRVEKYPYDTVYWQPLPLDPAEMEEEIRSVVAVADGSWHELTTTWGKMAHAVLYANHIWRTAPKETRFDQAMEALNRAPAADLVDWVVAQREWFERRTY